MCPSSTCGNPGISRSHICVDRTTKPSGKLILSGFVAGRTFFMLGVFFMIIIDVASVSATACVMGINGSLGCMLDAHICCRRVDKLSVTTGCHRSLSLCFGWGTKYGPNQMNLNI